MTNEQRLELAEFLHYFQQSDIGHNREDNFYSYDDCRINDETGEVTEMEYVDESYDPETGEESIYYTEKPVEGQTLVNFDKRLLGEARYWFDRFDEVLKPLKQESDDGQQ